TTPLSVSRRRSSERSKRGNSSSTPITSAPSTRRLSSRSCCPVSSPSRTTIVRSSRIAHDGNRVEHDDMGWSRKGRKGAFRYYDSGGKRITDDGTPALIEALAIPPAWKEVWISPRSTAKLQATGFDAAGRKQY